MILYKKDTKGKIRSLEIKTEGGNLYQISGLVDGKKVTNTRSCKGKNIGKSNETTPTTQAIKEAASKTEQKLNEGYFLSLKEAEEEVVILPMLAKDYKKESHKIDWTKPVYVQPKLDGMRAIGVEDSVLRSRKGQEIGTLRHLHKELKRLRSCLDGLTPDGEVYAHGLSFQENMKLIKKYRKGETEKVHYHVYAIIENVGFETRKNHLELVFFMMDFQYIGLVPTYRIKNEEELKKFHQRFLAEGYEGTIIRYGEEPYKVNGRSSNLLKYKDFLDTVATIVDVIPSDKRPGLGTFILKWPGARGHRYGNDVIGCGMKFSHTEREEMLRNKEKYISKAAELRYFEETDGGIPRFPVCYGIRLDV